MDWMKSANSSDDRVGVTFVKRSEEHTSELQSLRHLVCRLLLDKLQTRCGPGVPCCGRCGSTAYFLFFKDAATTEIYTLSLHDALPIFCKFQRRPGRGDLRK